MRKFFLAAAVVTALVAGSVSTASADGAQEVPYTCPAVDSVPSLTADVPVTTSDDLDPADRFDTVTWTAEIAPPPIQPPIDIDLRYLKITIDIPDGLRVVDASLEAPTTGTANPALNDISLTQSADEIVLQMPSVQAFNKRLRALQSGVISYPEQDFQPTGDINPVVAPKLVITGMTTFAAGGTTIDWLAPEVETQVFFGTLTTVTCTPDGEPDPAIISTTVTNTVDIPPHGFGDVPGNAWYGEGLDWAKHMNLVSGFPGNIYKPKDSVNRGQIANMLWQLMDAPPGSPPHGFGDVPGNAWYGPGLDWAKDQELVSGFPGNLYKPKDAVNRGQIVSMLWNLVGQPPGSPPHGFGDVPGNAWYGPALDWAKDQGLVSGFPGNQYKPKDAVNRGQISNMLFQLASNSDAWGSFGGTFPTTILFPTA